jgi:hypothetical protein
MHLYFFFFDAQGEPPGPAAENNSGGWWWYRKEEEKKKKKKEEERTIEVPASVEIKYKKPDVFVASEYLRKVGATPQVVTTSAPIPAPPMFIPRVVEKKPTRRLREDDELLLFF